MPKSRPRLADIDPKNTGEFGDKNEAVEQTENYLKKMYDLLYLMFAEDRRSLLIILHGMDAAGKDGTVRHLFSGANPQGIRVYSFKEPSSEELQHDYLWRCHRVAPERGYATIFNRSYYEEVTTVKVHPELLVCPMAHPKKLFRDRYRQINDFERMLCENGTLVLKFFLHISKEEQKVRLEERLEDPKKNWKFSPADIQERKYWREYQKAFSQMIEATHTKAAPWHIIPADRKWYRNLLVSRHIVEALEKQKMKFPRLADKPRRIK